MKLPMRIRVDLYIGIAEFMSQIYISDLFDLMVCYYAFQIFQDSPSRIK